MNRFPRREWRASARGGIAAIEFALVAPFIVLAMLACADLARFMRTVMQVDETANEVAIMVTEYANLYDSDFTDVFSASQTIADATPVTGAHGATIVSGIVNSGGKQTIAWQEPVIPSATFPSVFGAKGAVPVLPNGYLLPAGGTLIAVEVFTTASPWMLSANLMGGPGRNTIRSYALFQPRLGTLSVVNAGDRPP